MDLSIDPHDLVGPIEFARRSVKNDEELYHQDAANFWEYLRKLERKQVEM